MFFYIVNYPTVAYHSRIFFLQNGHSEPIIGRAAGSSTETRLSNSRRLRVCKTNECVSIYLYLTFHVRLVLQYSVIITTNRSLIAFDLIYRDPDCVVLCVLATDEEDQDDIALQIHFTLIQAFCCDNDINILRVSELY